MKILKTHVWFFWGYSVFFLIALGFSTKELVWENGNSPSADLEKSALCSHFQSYTIYIWNSDVKIHIRNRCLQMYRTDFWTLWEKVRVGCFERTASKHVYYLGWNRSPAQAGWMRQVLGPGALGRPRGIGLRGWWEGG